ncbi:MAG TPA: hypothetical protein GXX64_03565 [Bacteroidales bacterium]|nr:hypothetical protein [Bacteroidales bacterium]
MALVLFFINSTGSTTTCQLVRGSNNSTPDGLCNILFNRPNDVGKNSSSRISFSKIAFGKDIKFLSETPSAANSAKFAHNEIANMEKNAFIRNSNEKYENTRNFCLGVAVVTTEHAEYTEIFVYCAKSRDERL